MPNAQNKEMLASIKEDLDGVSAMWVVDYRGLTVKEMQQLRRDIRETGSVMKVYKNTLVFSGNDVAASAKALKTFAKANENLEIKGGLMEGAAVSAAEVEAIASLPSREQLMAQIAGAISGVARGLATTINGVPRGLAQVVKAVAEQKEAA